MRSASWIALSFVTAGAVALACGSSNERSGFDPNQSSGGPGSSSGNTSSGVIGGADGGSSGGAACVPTKGAYDYPGNNCDDDADGTVDNPPTCDGMVTGNAGEDLAKAMGVCTKASEAGYGLVSATITRGNGQQPSPNQHSVMPKFGDVVKPREGGKLVVLSTGYAQEFDGAAGTPFGGEEKGSGFLDPPKQYGKGWDANNQGAANALPAGFPKAASGCDQDSKVFDVVNVKLEMKAPPNAAGVKFDFNFFSGEWPAYICSKFNDGFIAYLSAPGFNNGKPDNISFDSQKNPVSVNNGFFDRCTPGVLTGCAQDGLGNPVAKRGTSTCPAGPGELGGTGFGIVKNWCEIHGSGGSPSVNGGSTGWLTSQAPIKGGDTFTIEFIIWDTGDGAFDSSVLLDNFAFVAGEVTTGTVRPPN